MAERQGTGRMKKGILVLFAVLTIIIFILYIIGAGPAVLSGAGHDTEIIVKEKYETPVQTGSGWRTKYSIVDTANTTYVIDDSDYPENMHVYDFFKVGGRYFVDTDGTTIYSITRHTTEIVFDEKSIRFRDGRWVHDEAAILEMLRDGTIEDPASVEWTARQYWTSLRYDLPYELWLKVSVYLPEKQWQYEKAAVSYNCLVGRKNVYPWRGESYMYIYEISNIDEYDRYYAGNPVTSALPATVPA